MISKLYHDKQQVPLVSGDFLQPCTTSCSSDKLACDPIDLVCRYSNGSDCNSSSDCTTGYLCQANKCVDGSTVGQLNDPCPCESGLICSSTYITPTCKLPQGSSCTTDSDCDSYNCSNGQCGLVPNGIYCTNNSDCESNYCSQNYCQQAGWVTGGLGTVCYQNSCTITDVKGSSCISSLYCDCSDNLCKDSVKFFEACSIDQVCVNSDCIDSNGFTCSSTETDCVCTFNPSNPSQTTHCQPGFELSDGICLSQTNYPCMTNLDCVSGRCADQEVMYHSGILFGATQPEFKAFLMNSYSNVSGPYQFMNCIISSSDGSNTMIYICLSSPGKYAVYQYSGTSVTTTGTNTMSSSTDSSILMARCWNPINTAGSLGYSLLLLKSDGIYSRVWTQTGVVDTLELGVTGMTGFNVNNNGHFIIWNSTDVYYGSVVQTTTYQFSSLTQLPTIAFDSIDIVSDSGFLQIVYIREENLGIYDSSTGQTNFSLPINGYKAGLSGSTINSEPCAMYINNNYNACFKYSTGLGLVQGSYNNSITCGNNITGSSNFFIYTTNACE